MNRISSISTMLVVAVMVLAVSAASFAAMPRRVVANVTTDDVNKAAMAIKFTHAIMKNKGVEATIFFNVYGVTLVKKGRPSPMYPTGQSIADMLKEFMADGGKVLACPMCMENVAGMTNADLMEGVASKPGAGLAAVMADDTMVLSY